MKIKGISPAEQHVEKIVLAVFALFAAAMFVLQFNIFGDPNAVDIGPRKNVPPGQAVDVVREQAQRLEGEIDGTVDTASVVPTIVGPLQRIEEALSAPAIDPSTWVVALGPGSSSAQTTTAPVAVPNGDVGAQAIAVVPPPAPLNATARAFGITLNPFVPVRIPELAALLPADQPFDLRAVSVQASFPAQEFRAALAAVPDNDAVRPLPRSWWDGQVELLDVEVIRDELGPDGSVVDSTTVPPVPGFASVRAQLADPATLPRDLPQIQEVERASREEIRRVPVFDAIAGEPWIWPALAAEQDAADPNREQVERLVSERRSIMREIEKIQGAQQKQQEKDANGGDRDTPPPPPPPGPSPGGRGGPAPSGGRKDAGSGAAIAKRIEDLKKRSTEIETKLKADFNRDPEGQPLDKVAVSVFTEAVTSLTDPGAPPVITVWTHDLSPEPGKTYQYRVRIWLTNPLCGHGDGLGADQKSLADALAIASPWSAPTAPVSVPQSPAFFVSSATTGEGLGGVALRRPPSASLDVFDFHYGFWRAGSATIAQGDGVRADIAIPALEVFTIVEDAAGAMALGETTMGPTSLPIVADVFLVTVIPGSTDAGDLVILANADGTVELRTAGIDADSAVEARMLDSASKSKNAKVTPPSPAGSKKQ